MAVAHLAFDFGARDERGDRVDDEHVDRIRAHQRIDDFKCLLARIGLRHDQFVDIDAQLLRIDGIERMFGVDESRGSAGLLRFGDAMQRESGLARAFGTVDFDDAATRQTADAERDVEPERSGRDRLDLHRFLRSELHHRALAERAIDLRECGVERLLPVCAVH